MKPFLPNSPLIDQRLLMGYHIGCDSIGPDFLDSKLLDDFYDLTVTSIHVIDQSDIGAPDALAFEYYGDEKLYWVILLFNGFTSHNQIRVGTRLRIPEKQMLLNLLTSSSSSESLNSNAVRKVGV